jgi:hypothetical protein
MDSLLGLLETIPLMPLGKDCGKKFLMDRHVLLKEKHEQEIGATFLQPTTDKKLIEGCLQSGRRTISGCCQDIFSFVNNKSPLPTAMCTLAQILFLQI